VFFLIAAGRLRRGRITAGAVFAGILCPFEILNFPSWPKHTALEWTTDTVFAVVVPDSAPGAAYLAALGRPCRRPGWSSRWSGCRPCFPAGACPHAPSPHQVSASQTALPS
jgi:hypothetical protein